MHASISERNYDVIIVGARCAGAATAMLLAREGVRVLALDRQSYGSDTLSTHALMRPAVMQLARWGLLEPLIRSGAPVIGTTTFHYGAEEIPIPIRPEPGIPGLIAPRRTVLDRMLVDAARAAGAVIVHDVAVQDLLRDPSGRVSGVSVRDPQGRPREIKAPLVIGADGHGSYVARTVQAAIFLRGKASACCIYGYADAPDITGYHWHFDTGASAGAIPTHDGQALIFAAAPTGRFDAELRHDLAASRMAILRAVAPGLAERAATGDTGRIRAFRGVPGLLRQPFGPGWMLVGDAGFFRDPATSHGISDAFRDAEGAVRAVLGGTGFAMRRYRDERDAIARPILETTEAIAACDWELSELGERHQRFSEAMKAGTRLIAERQALEAESRSAPPPARTATMPVLAAR
jgi:flavin-dependent dehydrogenase